MKNFNKILQEDEQKIINLYNSGISILKLSKLVNYSKGKIRNLLVKTHTHIKTYKEINKKYSLQENYFEIIDSKDKAYFLGFIIADGCVYKNKLKISLQKEDGYILELFKKYIQYTGILVKTIKEGNRKLQIGLTITNDKLTDDLINLGVIPAKTHFTYFPDIPEHLWSHFIRGVFDGDGCITFSKPKNRPSLQGTFSIVGNNLLINKIQQILIKECDLNKTLLYNPKDISDNITIVIYGGHKQLIKIREYLYKDCGDLFLTRKKEDFDLVKLHIFENSKKCSLCDNLCVVKGLCQKHYVKQWKNNKNK